MHYRACGREVVCIIIHTVLPEPAPLCKSDRVVLFPLSPGKGGEGDRTAPDPFSGSPSPGGRGQGLGPVRRRTDLVEHREQVVNLFVWSPISAQVQRAANQFAVRLFTNSSAAQFVSSTACSPFGAGTLTPGPFPKGEGETTTRLRAVLSPSPPFPGERGNRTEQQLVCVCSDS